MEHGSMAWYGMPGTPAAALQLCRGSRGTSHSCRGARTDDAWPAIWEVDADNNCVTIILHFMVMIYGRWVTVLQYIMVVMNLGMIYLGWIGDDSICFVHFLQNTHLNKRQIEMVWTWLLDSIISCEFGRGVRKPVQFTDDDCVWIVNSCKDSTNRVVFLLHPLQEHYSPLGYKLPWGWSQEELQYFTRQMAINSWFDFILPASAKWTLVQRSQNKARKGHE